MTLSTGLPLTQSNITAVPLTQFVKNAVEALALKQGYKRLKFTNKKGVELGNLDGIAGVDYDDLYQDEDTDSKDSENKDEEYTPNNNDNDDNNKNKDEVSTILGRTQSYLLAGSAPPCGVVVQSYISYWYR